MPANPTIEHFTTGGITYQLELVNCGKTACKRCKRGPAHGPYWYAYWTDSRGKQHSKYIGKHLPTIENTTTTNEEDNCGQSIKED
jgi:hypothetical protein